LTQNGSSTGSSSPRCPAGLGRQGRAGVEAHLGGRSKSHRPVKLILPFMFSAAMAIAAWSTSVVADDFEDCANASALISADASKAASACRRLAEKGDAAAQNALGALYSTGHGVPQDQKVATAWYRKAADQGLAEAQCRVATAYYSGLGVPRDYSEAANWARKSADQGFVQCQHNLGVAYAKGQGVTRDYNEAVTWYRKAADQGFGAAQAGLCVMYANGRGVPQDLVLAHMWCDLAVASGFKDATKFRNSFAGKMTPKQIADAKRKAREWKPKPEQP
jgi:TPR repeat protein